MTTILVVNIGTSDLTIQQSTQQGNYFIPIVPFNFGDQSKDAVFLNVSDIERQIFADRNFIYGQSGLCSQLEIPVETDKYNRPTASFLSITEKIYKNIPCWRSKLFPSRLLSVINEAKKLGVKTVYLFATYQPFRSDTYYLSQILMDWFQQHPEYDSLEIIIETIPPDHHIKNLDSMLNYYHNFFKKILNLDTTLLVSTRGGTEEMINALRVEAIASGASKQIFLEPELDGSVRNILDGKPSQCRRVSYWRSLQNQRYANAKRLLNKRWDFDGARVILEEWQETLFFLQEMTQDESIESNTEGLTQAVKLCNEAIFHLNLDKENLKSLDEYYTWLNLYTQCLIYWDLNEISSFLPRLGSFCEEILIHLIKHFSSNLIQEDNSGSLNINEKACNKLNPNIFQEFEKLEINQGDFTRVFRHKAEFGLELLGEWHDLSSSENDFFCKWKKEFENKSFSYEQLQTFIHPKNVNSTAKPIKKQDKKTLKNNHKFDSFDFKLSLIYRSFNLSEEESKILDILKKYLSQNIGALKPRYKIKTRYNRRNFFNALLSQIGTSEQKECLLEILSALETIEYWIDLRNDLIHSAKGYSKTSMDEQLAKDIAKWGEETEHDSFKANPTLSCSSDEIRAEMTRICRASASLLGINIDDYLYTNQGQNFYLYTSIRDQVCAFLS